MSKLLIGEDLHFLGIKVIYKHLVDNEYEVLNVRKELDVNPQILAKKDDQLYFIVVRTAVFPHIGVLPPEVASSVTKHAYKHKAVCLFARVGIANANGNNDNEMAKPIVGGEYYINFNGLSPFPQ